MVYFSILCVNTLGNIAEEFAFCESCDAAKGLVFSGELFDENADFLAIAL